MPSGRVQRQIDRLLDEAEAAMAGLDWDTVQRRSQATLALDEQNEDARSYLAAADKAVGSAAPTGDSAPAAPSNPLPSSFASGRYAVRSLLGEGGKKLVYLAHDERLDRDAALALIKTDGLDEPGRQRVVVLGVLAAAHLAADRAHAQSHPHVAQR